MKKMMMLIGAACRAEAFCVGLALFGAVQAWGVDVSTWANLKSNLEAGNSVMLTASVYHSGYKKSTTYPKHDESNITINGNVTLDLNGHDIYCYGDATESRPFIISGSVAVLTITGSGVIYSSGTTTSVNGSFAQILSSGKLVLSGGTIRSFKTSGNGGVVYVSSGTFDMSGGTITSCSASKNGGAVYMYSGTFNMSGGTISSCKSTCTTDNNYGRGGVYVASGATFNLNGGTISGCTSTGLGGAVYSAGTFTMNGGTISSCSSTGDGGGVFTAGTTANIYGGSITSCSSSNWGGAIAVDSGKYIYIYGGYFSGNTATSGCPFLDCANSEKHGYLYGGVYDGFDPTSNNDTVLKYGSVTTIGTKRVIGSGITTSSSKLTGGSYTFDPTKSEYGLSLYNSSYRCVGSGTSYTVYAPISVSIPSVTGASVSNITVNGSSVSVASSVSVPYGGSISVTYAANSGYVMVNKTSSLSNVSSSNKTLSGASTIAVSPDAPTSCSTWAQVKAVLEAGYSVKLTKDITQDTGSNHIVVTAAPVTLDLNGFTLTQGTLNSGPAAYLVNAKTSVVNLTIMDSVGSGVILGCPTRETTTGSGGGGFYLNAAGSSLTLESGTLKNFRLNGTGLNGGCIYVGTNTSFTMNGGMITNCTCSLNGGAVYSAGTFTMNGGAISGCQSIRGSVYNFGTFTMNGGTFSGNTACMGGAVYNNGMASIYGGVIKDNVAKVILSGSYAYGGALYCNNNSKTYIYGGSFSGNKAPSGCLNLCSSPDGGNAKGYLYGGVFAADPKSTAESTSGFLVLQNSAVVTQVGTKYVVGTGIASDANNKLTAGTYTFDPAKAEYAAAGVTLAPGRFTQKTGDLAWQILTGTPAGDSVWTYVKDGVCTIYGTGATSNDKPLDAQWASITNVVIADGVTGLGTYFFHKFHNLTNVTIAASCTTLGEGAFFRCLSLESVAFEGTSLPTLGENALPIRAAIKMEGDKPVVTMVPKVTVGGKEPTLQGSNDLSNWENVADGHAGDYHFFKYVVQ